MEAKIICLYTKGLHVRDIAWILGIDTLTINQVVYDSYLAVDDAKWKHHGLILKEPDLDAA